MAAGAATGLPTLTLVRENTPLSAPDVPSVSTPSGAEQERLFFTSHSRNLVTAEVDDEASEFAYTRDRVNSAEPSDTLHVPLASASKEGKADGLSRAPSVVMTRLRHVDLEFNALVYIEEFFVHVFCPLGFVYVWMTQGSIAMRNHRFFTPVQLIMNVPYIVALILFFFAQRSACYNVEIFAATAFFLFHKAMVAYVRGVCVAVRVLWF